MDTIDYPVPGNVLATLTYRPTVDHLEIAYRASYRQFFTNPVFIFVWVFVYGILGPVLLAVLCTITSSWWMSGSWFIVIDLGIVIVFGSATHLLLWALFNSWAPRTARRTFQQRKDLHEEWRVLLAENGMRTVTKSTDSYLAWTNFTAWSQDNRIIRLYLSDGRPYSIPASAITPQVQAVFDSKLAGLPRR